VGRPLGGKVLEISYLTKSFGDRNLVKEFTYNFVKGDRVGVVGRNGLGKTTFLILLLKHSAVLALAMRLSPIERESV
jgi:ATP-binding cassette subfamily F protein uup